MDIGARFRQLRISRKKLEAKRFAFDSGISWPDLRAFENNKNPHPSVDRILKFTKALNCSLAEFFSDQTDVPPEVRSVERKVIHLDSDEERYLQIILSVTRKGDKATIDFMKREMQVFEESIKRQQAKEAEKPRSGPMTIGLVPKPAPKAVRKRSKKGATG